MFQRILVPLDGSLQAEYALHLAAHIASKTHSKLILLFVVPPFEEEVTEQGPICEVFRVARNSDIQAASLYLCGLKHGKLLQHIATDIAVLSGEMVPSILEATRHHHCDLIILHTNQKSSYHPSTQAKKIEHLVRCTPIPLILLSGEKSDYRETKTYHALVPLDGTLSAESVLQPLQALLHALSVHGNAHIHLLKVLPNHGEQHSTSKVYIQHCMNKAYLLELQRQIKEAQGNQNEPFSITYSVTMQPDLIKTVEQDIEAHHYDVLACTTSTHKKHGLGWEAKHLLQSIQIPLLIMPPAPSIDQAIPVTAALHKNHTA